MDIQRLRNLTTTRLHTQVDDVYKDIGALTGEPGVMTHMIPNALIALGPYLREKAPDPRLWDGAYDGEHVGEMEVPAMDETERAQFWKRYLSLPAMVTLLDS